MTMASRSPRSCMMRSVSSLSSRAWASRRATAAANNNEGKRVGKVARRGQRSQQTHSQKHQQKWVHKSVHQECEHFPTAQSCNTTPKTHWVMQARRQCDLGSSKHTGQTIHRQWVGGWLAHALTEPNNQQRQEKGRVGNNKTNPPQPLRRDPWPPPAPRPQPPHPPHPRRHLPPHQSTQTQAQAQR